MKKSWIQPMATVEKFVANEYVAACWTVVCDSTETERAGVSHRKQYCGADGHYQIELDANGTPISMTEIKTDNLGDLPCTLYTDGTYKTVRNVSDVKSGEYIYWTTSKGDRTWHHHGPVNGTSNHS